MNEIGSGLDVNAHAMTADETWSGGDATTPLERGRRNCFTRTVSETRLMLTCGLPGAGKTALARQLADERRALRLTKDEWLIALGSNPWDEVTRVNVERQLWHLARDALRLGVSVVLDFGLWARRERDELRTAARELAVGVELHYLDVPIDELWRRIDARNAAPPWDSSPISRSHLDEWAAAFEAPQAGELALYDRPPPTT